MGRRYKWDTEAKCLVELAAEWGDRERRAPTANEEALFGNLVATDGTPLNTRRRHEQYMKEKGLALTSDFKEAWSPERRAAEAAREETKQDREAYADVARAYYQRKRR